MEALTTARSEFPSGDVYHYTSQKGLLGIITHKTIWATSILYLNDATELSYAIELAQSEIEKLGRERTEEVSFLDDINRRLVPMTWFSGTSVYVCSFSTEPDQLSQWRGYCPDGNGFSVGFDFSSSLYELIRRQEFGLFKCVYDENEQSQILKQLLIQAIETWHQTENQAHREPEIAKLMAIQNFEIEFIKIAPILKHPKFREENEWRLISRPTNLDHPQVRFREGKSMLIPYFELNLVENVTEPLANLPEIWIGPTPHWHLSRSSVQSLLIAQRVSGQCVIPLGNEQQWIPCVRISEVPYRAW